VLKCAFVKETHLALHEFNEKNYSNDLRDRDQNKIHDKDEEETGTSLNRWFSTWGTRTPWGSRGI